MKVIPLFRYGTEAEFDQRIELLEMRMADIRKFKELSANQKYRLISGSKAEVKEVLKTICQEAAEMYEWAHWAL